MNSFDLVVVIPTRNRSDLARRAVTSALSLGDSIVARVFLSDNSTDPAESRSLDALVRSLADERLTLLRPPQPLSMTLHWDWAMKEVLTRPEIGRVAYLTDRMIFRRDWFAEAVALSRKFPDDIVSYANDALNDEQSPIVYRPSIRSGKAYRVQSTSLLELSSRMVFYTCLPRMLNCIAPRAHLEKLHAKYGTFFGSVSPDFCFCYRSLEAVESIIYVDKSIMLCHGFNRSNGNSFVRGRATDASKDFLANLDSGQAFATTLLPHVQTVGNAIASEYMKVRAESGSPRMPDVSKKAYLEFLASETRLFEDAEYASAVKDQLQRAGWKPGLGFQWRSQKVRWLERMHSMFARRFVGIDEAIHSANANPGKLVPWLHNVARQYRAEQVDIA